MALLDDIETIANPTDAVMVISEQAANDCRTIAKGSSLADAVQVAFGPRITLDVIRAMAIGYEVGLFAGRQHNRMTPTAKVGWERLLREVKDT